MLTTTRPIRYTRHNRLDEFLYIHTIHVSDIKRADCTPEVTSRDPNGDNVTTGGQSALRDFNVPQFDVPVNPTPHNEYKKGGCESGSNLARPKTSLAPTGAHHALDAISVP